MDCKSEEIANDSRKRLLNFIDISTLKKILNSFTMATNLTANIVDIEGKSIFSKKDQQQCCKFCRLIYSHEHGLERCQGAYKRAGKQCAIFSKPYIFRCPSGLIEFAAPIIVNEEHLGTIICGQVLMWEPEEFFWLELREMNKDIMSDFKELFEAVKELPIISGEKVEASSYMIYVLSNYIMKSGWENYNYIKELEHQQCVLHEEVENRKLLEVKLNDKTFANTFERENEFINNLKMGNLENSKTLFSNLITDIYTYSHGNIEIIRTKIIELLVLTSRTVIAMGVPLEKASDINNKLFIKIMKMKSIEEISILASNTLDCYIEYLKDLKINNSDTNVEKIIEFIKKHYNDNLTLDSIASVVYLSTSYASRIFKKAKKVSIMEYVTYIRMENAKYLLCNPNYKIDDIAQNVGYTDSSYFTKVFKKYEGITPVQYRKLN